MKGWARAGLLAGLLIATHAPAGATEQVTQCVSNAVAGGTVNAITVPLLPCGLATNLLLLTTAGPNTSINPTLQMVGYAALPIQNADGTAVGLGGIPGGVVLLTGTGTKWLLLTTVQSSSSGSTTLLQTRRVTVAGAAAILTTDQIIGMAKTVPATTTLTLPAASNWPLCAVSGPCPDFLVKDLAGNASSYPTTIVTADGSTIDGQSNVLLNYDYGAAEVFLANGNWFSR